MELGWKFFCRRAIIIIVIQLPMMPGEMLR